MTELQLREEEPQDERGAAVDYFTARRAAGDNDPLTSFCHALLNLNEFIYLD